MFGIVVRSKPVTTPMGKSINEWLTPWFVSQPYPSLDKTQEILTFPVETRKF